MGDVKDKGKTGGRARTPLPIRTLNIISFHKVPHKAYVRDMIKDKLRDLHDVLRINFTGKAKRAVYVLTFLHKYNWGPNEKIGYSYFPSHMGFSEEVNADLLRKWNFCEDSNDPKTCTLVFPDKPEMLGRVIANTALHEIGHVFGLLDEKSYTGADQAGHTGDSSNCMFDIPLHKEYKKNNERTTKYVIKTGETLDIIARRRGLPSAMRLSKLRGKDGRTNAEILTMLEIK